MKSDVAAEKKRAEVAADEVWLDFQSTMDSYIAGSCTRKFMEACFQDFKHCHNIERGLRHEPED